jgi:signal transduction histidine kinase
MMAGMGMVFLDFARNIGLLTLVVVGYTILGHSRLAGWRRDLAVGVIFGLGNAMALATTLQIVPGLLFDGRAILLALAASFGGWPATVLVVIATGLYRLVIGGTGTVAALVNVVMVAGVGLAFATLSRRKAWPRSFQSFLLLGLVAAVIGIVVLYLLRPDIIDVHMQTLLLPILVIVPLSTGLMGVALHQQDERNQLFRDLGRQTKLLGTVFAAITDGVAVADESGRIILGNPKSQELAGVDANRLTPAEWAEAFQIYRIGSSAHFPTEELPLLKAVNGIASDNVELDVVNVRDSVRRTLNVSGRPLFDDAGKPAGGVAVFRDVSEERAAHAAMLRSELRLKEAIEALPNGFSLFDAEDRLVLWNERLISQVLRGKIGDPAGMSFEQILRALVAVPALGQPGHVDSEDWIRRRLVQHRTVPETPLEHQLADGRWVRVSERRTADGGTVGVWADITDVRLAERRLHDAINTMEDGFGLFDADDRIILHNTAFMDEGSRLAFGNDVTGRTFEEIVRAFADHVLSVADPSLDREAWITERMERHRNPPPTPLEVKWGPRRWMRISERRLADGGYIGVWTDISRQKQAEQRLRDAIESISEGFALLDADGCFVIVNSHFAEMYPLSGALAKPGLRYDDMLRHGAAHGEYPGISTPEQVSSLVAQWRDCRAQRRVHAGERGLSDGRWVMFSHDPTTNDGYVIVCTDITAQKQREIDLQKAKDDLEERSARLVKLATELEEARRMAEAANIGKSRFLANMSHELRTPMNAVLGFSELMLKEILGPIQPVKYRDYIKFIHEGGEHLLSLVNDVLDLSKIEAGKLDLQIEQVSTREIVSQAVETVKPMAADRQVTVTASIRNNCPIIHADRRALRQILLNLLSNAVKFTPAKGSITVSISNVSGTGIHLSVADTGIGMTQKEMAKALEPYGQIQSSMAVAAKGSGLGLPLVKSLVELHGGSLSMISEKGKGTTVNMFFPWHRDVDYPSLEMSLHS